MLHEWQHISILDTTLKSLLTHVFRLHILFKDAGQLNALNVYVAGSRLKFCSTHEPIGSGCTRNASCVQVPCAVGLCAVRCRW